MTVVSPHSRRRGEALVQAIRVAVIEELATRGYDAFSIESVAERARTGKASIYRRWPSKLDLVLDALDDLIPDIGKAPDTGSVRDDLLVVLRRLAKQVNSMVGNALSACMADVKHHPELSAAVREQLWPSRNAVIVEVLERGILRGEVRPDAVSDRVVELGPILLHTEQHMHGTPIRDKAVVAIVDEVLVPLVRA